jgi:anti-anti-sigma regulatory factor
VGEAHVITVSGEANGAELDAALRRVYEDGGDKVAVDLSRFDTLDAAFLEVLLRHLAGFRARGGDIVIACTDELMTDGGGSIRVGNRVEDAVAALLGDASG